MTLKKKLILFSVMINMIILIFIFSRTYFELKKSIEDSTINSLSASVDGIQSEIVFLTEVLKTRVFDLSTDSQIIAGASDHEKSKKVKSEFNLLEYITGYKKGLIRYVLFIDIIDLNGRVISSTKKDRIGNSKNNEDYFKKIRFDNKKFYIRDIVFRKEGSDLTISAPIMKNDISGKLAGILAVHFDASIIQKLISGDIARDLEIPDYTKIMGKTGEIYLVNEVNEKDPVTNEVQVHDYVIASTIKDIPMGKSISADNIRKAFNTNDEIKVAQEKDFNNIPILYIAQSMTIGDFKWVVIATISQAEALAPIVAMKRDLALLFLFITIIVIFINIIFANSLLKPILKLKEKTRKLGKGDFSEEETVYKNDEIGDLTRDFDKMVIDLKKVTASRDELDKEMQIRKQTQEELVRAKDNAEAANNAKSEFLANMSHELRTPLNSVIGFSEVLYDELFGPVNEKQKNYLNNVLTSAKHLLSLINDILDLSKIESGKMTLSVSEFSLRELLENSLIMIKEKALKNNINISADIASDIGNITADERKVKQIVFNLLSNASKFTPAGGKIGIKARKTGNMVEVVIWDTGIGISKDNLQKVFEEFYQVENTFTKTQKGTGLGLGLVKKLVELHGGEVFSESEGEGKGSAFIFRIPLINEDKGENK